MKKKKEKFLKIRSNVLNLDLINLGLFGKCKI